MKTRLYPGVALYRRVRLLLRSPLAHREAVRLAQVMWRRTYRDAAPHWQPLDDTAGVISQIDNMHAGVLQDNDRMRFALEQIAHDPANAVTYFEDKWRRIAKQALQPNTGDVARPAAGKH